MLCSDIWQEGDSQREIQLDSDSGRTYHTVFKTTGAKIFTRDVFWWFMLSWTHLVVLIDPICHGCFDQLLVTRVGGIYGVKPLCTWVLDLGINPQDQNGGTL